MQPSFHHNIPPAILATQAEIQQVKLLETLQLQSLANTPERGEKQAEELRLSNSSPSLPAPRAPLLFFPRQAARI